MANILTGYGAVFFSALDPKGTEYLVATNVYERIAPTAFDKTLREDGPFDCYFNHDFSIPLGRSSAKARTLNVSRDVHGLFYTVVLPNSPNGQNVMEAARRGDIAGSSFSFVVRKQTLTDEMRGTRRVVIRTIDELQLLEVGPVTRPAYKGTTVDVVSVE